MLSKNQYKFIKSLKSKKKRSEHAVFLVEGVKVVQEFLKSRYNLVSLYSTSDFDYPLDTEINKISENELKGISSLITPNKLIGVFKILKPDPIDFSNLVVALDRLNDPGNLGAIIRLCDWFGIKDLVCDKSTVDCYNPKVVQAAMGSHTRVNITYTDLFKLLSCSKNLIGTFMDGNSIYQTKLPDSGILILGNESNGISKKIEDLVNLRIGVPRFGKLKQTESLNVANSAAIILSEFMRSSIEK
tara:strand:- start:1735 stop:2466 length:732 start_codon:yes stop_codon:yes gene_type:complete